MFVALRQPGHASGLSAITQSAVRTTSLEKHLLSALVRRCFRFIITVF